MPRLSSQSKHEEFESNSTLRIRFKRKEGAEAEKEEKQRILHHSERISHHSAKISHWCEIDARVKFSLSPFVDYLVLFSLFATFSLLI